MSKYTKQLKEMAEQYVDAKNRNDPRCLELMMTMSMITGINPAEVDRKIRHFAIYGEW